MRHILLHLLILLLLTSCNYKELGCVICYKKKRTVVTTYDNGQIKTIEKEKFVTKAIDAPSKTSTRYKEFDSTGVLIKKRKRYRIVTVWSFDYINSGEKETIYYPKNDSIKKEITVLKNGKLISNKKIKK